MMNINEHTANQDDELQSDAGDESEGAEIPQGAHSPAAHSAVASMLPASANIGHNSLVERDS